MSEIIYLNGDSTKWVEIKQDENGNDHVFDKDGIEFDFSIIEKSGSCEYKASAIVKKTPPREEKLPMFFFPPQTDQYDPFSIYGRKPLETKKQKG